LRQAPAHQYRLPATNKKGSLIRGAKVGHEMPTL
jgi:hypothetical protein